jgi:hypothetical protein
MEVSSHMIDNLLYSGDNNPAIIVAVVQEFAVASFGQAKQGPYFE